MFYNIEHFKCFNPLHFLGTRPCSKALGQPARELERVKTLKTIKTLETIKALIVENIWY